MPFEIVRNDIVNMEVDAVVNTANPEPIVGTGVDTAIHKAAGPKLLEARKEIGALAAGEAAATPGFDLPAKYVIHVSGPSWVDGSHGEEELLRQCYRRALALAEELGCESIAFPLLSSGNYGFPRDLSLRIAIDEFGVFLLEHDMQVTLAVFSEESYRLSSNLFASVDSYIDEHYVDAAFLEEYGEDGPRARRNERQHLYGTLAGGALPSEALPEEDFVFEMATEIAAPQPVFEADRRQSLEELMEHMDAGFSDTLFALIDATGKKPSAIYKKANVSKQVFSKINSNPHYQPKKPTAVGFCMALELDLEETQMLLARAGYTLSHSILFDVIVESFIVSGNYNVFELNAALYEHDQPLVGSNAA